MAAQLQRARRGIIGSGGRRAEHRKNGRWALGRESINRVGVSEKKRRGEERKGEERREEKGRGTRARKKDESGG